MRLDSWTASFAECVSERDIHGGHLQERYSDTFGRNLKLAVEQIVRQIRTLVEWWDPDVLNIPIAREHEEVRN